MSHTVVVKENGQGRYQQEIIVNGRHHLLADEPLAAGGDDAGAAPFDFLMAGLGACTAMTLRMYAERKEISLDKVTVELEHDKIDQDGKLLDRMTRRITLEGQLSPEQRQRMLEIANKCPAYRVLRQPVEIDSVLAD